jgi:hypothetical protein
MLGLQAEIGGLEPQKAEEEKILRRLVAAVAAGGEPFRKVVLAKTTGHKDWPVRAAAARIAGAAPGEPASFTTLHACLEKEPDARVRLAALEALQSAEGKNWHDLVIGRLADAEWGVQLLAARIAGSREMGKAIPALITALAKATPRVAEEVNASLRRLTQQNFDGFADVWAKWWAAEGKEKFDKDGKPLQPVAMAGTRPSDAAFYGIKVKSDKVVFVIDISGSMKEEKKKPPKAGAVTGDGPPPEPEMSGSKLEFAKTHLKKAIRELSEKSTFNIVAFNHSVTQWQDKMMVASKENKELAYAWIRDFAPKGATYVDGALRMAFKLAGLGAYDKHYVSAVDTMYVLSDGAPTDNGNPSKDMPPEEILARVREWNLSKQVVVHCIGIDNVVVGIKFLKDLAAENGGTYVDG